MVSPNEINSLRVGIPVKIQLNPYKQRLVPRVDGEVYMLCKTQLYMSKQNKSFSLLRLNLINTS